ncbi:MAG: phosphatidylserine/phosphatidylglycerophosphate/cardiolipin synthase family protein [Verrucomicrobiota bacterium]
MITLLSDIENPDGAEMTFRRVKEHICAARRSIEIHMFVWRNDVIGQEIGEAVLEAAERGVAVRIIKDVGAFMYERIEMNRKSFFNKPISFKNRWVYRLIRPTFPDTFCKDDHTDELGWKIIHHPNVSIEWVNHTHTKYYLFDDEVMLTGSINIEDRHRGYLDYMIRIEGREHIERFRQRQSLQVPHDATRRLDFVLNSLRAGARRFEIKDKFLELMRQAKTSLYIEMAYIGDPEISAGITAAAARGVEVTMLFSREANVGNDINYKSMDELYRNTPMKAYLADRMIHSKLMMIDDSIVIMGSANFSVFSMQKAEELNVVIQDDTELMGQFRKTIAHRKAAAHEVVSADEFSAYNKPIAYLQQLHQKLNDLFN